MSKYEDALPSDTYKMVLIGDGGVGKSAITLSLTQHIFITEYDPTIENAYRKPMSVDDRICVLDILDTAGQEEFSAMREAYFRQGQGFMIVWSVGDRGSFDSAGDFYRKILRVKDAESFPVVFCGNKADLPPSERLVSEAEGKALGKSCGGAPYLETSAKVRLNIEASFETLIRLVRNYNKVRGLVEDDSVRIKKRTKRTTKGGCTLL
ncbi:Ras GTPase [Pelomyxa schiedti]|nr:Ras GTPase [Pelomyxa schiedti]